MFLKSAMWALGIILLSIFGLVLINLFGNITVTNQQNYTLMKNSVEAAMYDAIDYARYRSGFCLCSNKQKTEVDGKQKWVFNSSSEYNIKDVTNNTCESNGEATCEFIVGEFKIRADVFAESLVRRFSESVKGNKNFEIIVQDVIEYPPKVSVEIISYDKYGLISSSTKEEFSEEDFGISNRVDAILEEKVKEN